MAVSVGSPSKSHITRNHPAIRKPHDTCNGCLSTAAKGRQFPRCKTINISSSSSTNIPDTLGCIFSNRSLNTRKLSITFCAKLADVTSMVRHTSKPFIQFIRSDGGPDFSSHQFEQVLDKFDINHEHITGDRSEQMGIVKRKIGVISERTRVCLHWAQLPQPWWGEAVKYVVQTLNLTLSYALGFMSPYYMRT